MYPITAGLIVESKELWGEVKEALARWPALASEIDVSRQSLKNINARLNGLRRS